MVSSPAQVPEVQNALASITQLVACGNSIIATGAGSSDGQRDFMTRLAQMINCKEVNWAKGGAAAAWNQDITNGEFGLWVQVYQNHKRPVRPASTLNANPAIGATSLTLLQSNASATGAPFAINQLSHVGTGDTGATGGEIMGATAAQSGTTLAVAGTEDWELEGGSVGAERDHASGDPIYEVPTQYVGGNTLYVLNESYNHLGHHGLSALSESWYKHAMRAAISRLRCGEVYESDHTANAYGGAGWVASIAASNSCSGSGVGGQRVGAGLKAVPNTNGVTVTLHLPNNFPGGTAVMAWVASATAGNGIWSFTVDGVSAGTLQPPKSISTAETIRAHNITYSKRFTGLAAGRHQIVATFSTAEAGHYFDWSGIEAPEPPVVLVMKPHRLYDYALMGSGWEHGHIPLKLNAQANAGATSIVVPQTWRASACQVAATPNTLSTQGPAVGDLIVIAPDTANQEVRTVTSVTGTGPFTINFSGGGLANTHAANTEVETGICDYELGVNGEAGTIGAWLDDVCNEFDNYVIRHNPDRAIHGTSGTKNRNMYWPRDLAHWSDEGHSAAAEDAYDTLCRHPRITPRQTSRLARSARLQSLSVDFVNAGSGDAAANNGALQWPNMLAAVTEFMGAAHWRQQADLSNFTEFRLWCNQHTAGATNAKLRLQYSIDSGTTWFYMGRRLYSIFEQTSTDFSEPTLSTENAIGDLAVGTGTGLKTSFWGPIYPDAQVEFVQLRLIGIGGDGVIDPRWMKISAEFR